MDDYVFFGHVYRWPPSETDLLKWSFRKKIKQAYKDQMINNQK